MTEGQADKLIAGDDAVYVSYGDHCPTFRARFILRDRSLLHTDDGEVYDRLGLKLVGDHKVA